MEAMGRTIQMRTKYKIPDEYLALRPEDPLSRCWAQNVVSENEVASVRILGYSDDNGILANLGRPGAALAPDEIRKIFYKLPAQNAVMLHDFGNFKSGLVLSETQAAARSDQLKMPPVTLQIALGGGHDWAAIDFDKPGMQVLHLDTHLDVRPYQPGNPHSGMPFRYLVEKNVKIFCLGAQPEHNSLDHWTFAQKNFSGLWTLDEVNQNCGRILDEILEKVNLQQPLGISLDLDTFPQSVSPGVSAPSARGLSVEQVVQIVDKFAESVGVLGIYELSPPFDRDLQSTRLAAFFLSRLLEKKFR